MGRILRCRATLHAALVALPASLSGSEAASAPPLARIGGRPYRPVVTLNGWSLPFRMRSGSKDFHLVANLVEREFAPGRVAGGDGAQRADDDRRRAV